MTSPGAKTPRPNGPAGAAILAAGVGCCALGLSTCAADASSAAARFFTFYAPTGPLSGVSSCAVFLWLAAWFLLSRRWRAKAVPLAAINRAAFALIGLGLLLTFPPIVDLVTGR